MNRPGKVNAAADKAKTLSNTRIGRVAPGENSLNLACLLYNDDYNGIDIVQFLENYSLRALNTFGIEARARFFSAAADTGELMTALEYAQAKNMGLFVLGGGSNILLLGNPDLVVLKNNLRGIETIEESEKLVRLRVGGGVVWHDLVSYAVAKGWGGIENLSLIPGTVGAAPIQNIGAYGTEIKDVFESLEAVHMHTGDTRLFSHADCRFGYRDSIFKREEKGRWIITSVTLQLTKAGEVNTSYGDIRKVLLSMGIAHPGIADVSRAVIQIRQSKLPDPAEIGNAGSFFKNPEVPEEFFLDLKERFPAMPGYHTTTGAVKIPAGWLIESNGWKGYREGNVGVHDRQALVLVNYGGATGEEVRNLASGIQESVEQKYGIKLHPEVNYI